MNSQDRGAIETLAKQGEFSFEEVMSDLESFFALLQKWQVAQNLVSRETLQQFWSRHALDSLQLIPLIGEDQRVIVDLGSGGGFPAIPAAIALRDRNHVFHLVDSNRRKVSFLRTVGRELGLNIQVHHERIEKVSSLIEEPVDLITSRATASLELLLALSEGLITPKTQALLHKGREFGEEVAIARAKFQFDMVDYKSLTDVDSAILRLANITSRV